MTTAPEVFVIESLSIEDEKNDRFEGKIISGILRLNEKKNEYQYVRTAEELNEALSIFHESNYRYLHLSCHGNSEAMATTFETIRFPVLGEMLRPRLLDRRLFISACEMVNGELAAAIIPGSGCYSIIGPSVSVAFSDAAILWASFYHLMFRHDTDGMKRHTLLTYCRRLARLFGVPLKYFSSSRRHKCGFKLTTIDSGRKVA